MKKDGEIKLLLDERAKGLTQKLAAARSGMCERTARKYERVGKLPSQLKKPRAHRTRENPFAADWPWVAAQIEDDPALRSRRCSRCCARPSPGATRRGSCARCSGMFRRGGYGMARSRR